MAVRSDCSQQIPSTVSRIRAVHRLTGRLEQSDFAAAQ